MVRHGVEFSGGISCCIVLRGKGRVVVDLNILRWQKALNFYCSSNLDHAVALL